VIVDAVAAMLIGWFVVPVATFTGNSEALCSAMRGTYTAQGPDRCPDGHWAALVPLLR